MECELLFFLYDFMEVLKENVLSHVSNRLVLYKNLLLNAHKGTLHCYV
jgi:hypothetical protein